MLGRRRSWTSCWRNWNPENKVTEGDIDRMEALSAEFRKFSEDVEAGRA
jgi:hypothetical protein